MFHLQTTKRISNLSRIIFFGLLFSSCAGPKVTQQQLSQEEVETQLLLSQAAHEFQAPNAPQVLKLLDQADVEWRADKSMQITVHQIWAARAKPERPLPVISLNQDSQALTVETLQLYDLDSQGNFGKSPVTVALNWSPPEANLPLSLSQVTTARLPELLPGQALDFKYTLETKTTSLLEKKDIHKDALKPHPVPAEASFAFEWNGHIPSLKRDLNVRIPKDVELYGSNLRIPKNLTIEEDKTNAKVKVIHFAMGPQDPLPPESFQPPTQDLSPLTAFTLSKSWDEALQPYRKRVKQTLDGDMTKVYELLGDAGSNTGMAVSDRLAQVKAAIHQKVEWVDTGLPVYLNPERPLNEIIDSGKGTSHDMAVLLAVALKAIKLNPQLFLYRSTASGELLGDLPALSQLDGVLVGVQTSSKDWIFMDPTEPLAAPGILPMGALDRKALAVLAPLAWRLTPSFSAKDHRKHRDVTMSFDKEGRVKCTVDLQAFGSSELALRQFFRATTGDKRRELVLKGLSKRFPGAILTDYHFGDYHSLTTPLDVHYSFEVPNFIRGTEDGGYIFVPLVFEDIEDFFTILGNQRQTPVLIPQNFNSETQAIVKLPDGFKPGDLPKDIAITNSVAEFSSTAKVQFATLSYERYMGLKRRRIELGKEYQDLLTFYQAVLSQDRTPFKVVPAK